VGVLTAGLVKRAAAFERGVIYALSPFLCPDWYERVEND
jgi:non-canonical (house-cleaning) NTP pyrophosphatase